MNKSNVILERIAHFLCVNIEASSVGGLQGKMTMLFFLFSYGKQLNKQYYVDLAFEILEEYLTEALLQFQTKKSNHTFDLRLLETGWGIQKYVSMGFFESDDMCDILRPFDELALQGTVDLIGKELSSEDIFSLILIASYFRDRLQNMEVDVSEFLTVKDSLEEVRLLLNNSSPLLNESPNLFVLASGLWTKELNRYQILFSRFVSGLSPVSHKEEKKVIIEHLFINFGATICTLYEGQLENYEKALLNIMLRGSMLLDNKTFQQQEYLAYCMIPSLKTNI